MFFLRSGVNDPLYLEDSFVNLARVLTVFNEQNNQEQMGVVGKGRGGGGGGILFPNAKRMNLKVSSVSPISDL